MMDRDYVLSHYSDMIEDGSTTAAIYDRLLADTGYTAYIKGDNNLHYSRASLSTYILKLRFRVINNVFDVISIWKFKVYLKNHCICLKDGVFAL